MATEFARINGSYSTAYIGRYDLLSQNTSGNYSTFRLYGVFYYGGGTSVGSSYSTFTLHTSTIKTGSYRYYPGETQLGYVDVNISHNADGSFPSTYIGISANSYHINGSAGGYLSAPSIPRQANITGANNFNSDANPYMTYSNPGNFRMNFRLEFGGATINRNSQYGTGGGYTFQLTDEERNLLYSKCPNSNSLTVRYVVATFLNSSSETHWSYLDRTMTVVNSNPTFDYFKFEDVGTKTTSLTGNPATIIKGYSEVYVGIPVNNKAVAKNYATISKYRAKIGESTVDIPYNDEYNVGARIRNASSSTITCYAIDSRNNSTAVEKQAENFIDYNPVTKGSITVNRQNGVSENVTLQINGTYHNVNFGVVTNSIKVAKYRYKPTDSSTWSEYQDLEINQSDGNFSFDGLIRGDTEEYGFDIGNSYQFEVYVEDELSSVTFAANLSSGIPNIALSKNGVGIMGKYDESEGGLLQVGGKNIFVKDAMTIYSNSRFDMNSGNKVNGLTEHISVGNKLTYGNSSIKIGKGVSKILVSATFSYWNSKNHWQSQLDIKKSNGQLLARCWFETENDTGQTDYATISPMIAEVEEDDEIILYFGQGEAQTINVLADGKATFLTVQVLE